jgi:aryl-alcohol dehydrogenase-like predicted oxidoreductase
MNMEYRTLGNTGLKVSVIGMGCSRIGRSIFEDNRKQARVLLEKAFEAGINYFDTAATYAYGDSERLLGELFATRRDRVIIATKGGYCYSSSARYAQYLLPAIGPFRRILARRRPQLKRHSRKRQDFSARFLRDNLEQSLRRLRTDYVDLYQLHSPPADVIESDEVLRFLEDSIREGKVRYCAASVNSIAEARLCLKHPLYAALQLEFNLVEQEAATEVLPLARSRGVGVIVKMPLARGLLTNNYHVMTGPAPDQYDPASRDRRAQVLDFLVSENHPSVEIAALRFILDHRDVATVLTGTTNPDHLHDNLQVIEAGPLPVDIMRKARALREGDLISGPGEVP